MARWLILNSNYVTDVIVWDGITPYNYPYPYDSMIEDTTYNIGIGDWYETSEDVFYRPIGKTPPDFPGNP
jgi:hypothetical protein